VVVIARRTHGTTTDAAIRPFHEAMSRRTRRIRHSRQVFGLAGTHRVLLVAVASQSGDQC